MMLHTESKARTKWCPFARTILFANTGQRNEIVAANRHTNGFGDGGSLCLASECMAWRWAYDTRTASEWDREEVEKQGFVAHGVSTDQIGPLLRFRRQTDHGFCGLAGNHAP